MMALNGKEAAGKGFWGVSLVEAEGQVLRWGRGC